MTKYRKERLPTHPCRGKKDFQGSMARLAEICRRSVKLFLVSRPPSSCLYTRFTSSTSQSWKIHGFTLLKNSQWLGNISFSFFICILCHYESCRLFLHDDSWTFTWWLRLSSTCLLSMSFVWWFCLGTSTQWLSVSS